MVVAALAMVVWAASMVVLVFDQDTLVRKNERLVIVVDRQEVQIETLSDRLACRSQRVDETNDAVGRGLVAVAQDDSAGLAMQAQRIIEIVNRPPCD